MPNARLGEGTAPPEILAALREIDARADLIHLGGTKWWLGTRQPNPAAVERLAHAHAMAAATPPIDDPVERAVVQQHLGLEFEMLQHMAAGFCPIHLYDCEGAPGREIVEDFRLRDFNWRTKSERQIQRELKESVSADLLNKPRIARFAEAAREVAAESFRYVFRRARSVLVGAHLE